jgi:hypothetical protein
VQHVRRLAQSAKPATTIKPLSGYSSQQVMNLSVDLRLRRLSEDLGTGLLTTKEPLCRKSHKQKGQRLVNTRDRLARFHSFANCYTNKCDAKGSKYGSDHDTPETKEQPFGVVSNIWFKRVWCSLVSSKKRSGKLRDGKFLRLPQTFTHR